MAKKPTGRPCIYGLYDKDGDIRYIGKANNPASRLKSHMRDARRRYYPVYQWIRANGEPEMRVLEWDCEDWEAAERKWIQQARESGARLLNLQTGGNQPVSSLKINRENGRKLNEKLKADPIFARIRFLKAQLGIARRSGYLSNKTVDKMRALAGSDPKMFGSWKDLPYRGAANG